MPRGRPKGTDNKTDKPEYMRDYMRANKEKYKEYYTTKIECECGGRYAIHLKQRHIRTNKHIKFMDKYTN